MPIITYNVVILERAGLTGRFFEKVGDSEPVRSGMLDTRSGFVSFLIIYN
jgi:hypothetical protein